MSLLPYPFNCMGFSDHIVRPLKQCIIKNRIIKHPVSYHSLDNAVEVVFDMFTAFCKQYPSIFIERWISHQNDLTKSGSFYFNYPEGEQTFFKKEFIILSSAEKYVTVTRKQNQILYEEICELWRNSFIFEVVDGRLKSKYKNNQELFVEWEMDYDTLVVKRLYYITHDPKHPMQFNPVFIELAMDKIDTKVAKEIIDLKEHIWV